VNVERQFQGEPLRNFWQPALFVLQKLNRGGAAGQADRVMFADAKDEIVPAFIDQKQRLIRQYWVINQQQLADQGQVDLDFSLGVVQVDFLSYIFGSLIFIIGQFD